MLNRMDNQSRYPVPNLDPNHDTIKNPAGGLRVVTYSGFSHDEVISAFQKCCRRGLTEEAIQWALEAYWTNKPSRTNIWNRALTVALEDVGPASPTLVLDIYHLRNIVEGGGPVQDARSIALATKLLSTSLKSRVNDWAVCINKNTDFSKEDPEKCKEALIQSLRRKDCLKSAFYIDALTFTENKIRGQRYKNAAWYIWQSFETVFGQWNVQLVSTLKELAMSVNWRWKKGSTRLIYYHLLHLYCFDVEVPVWTPPNKLDDSLDPLIQRYHRHEGLVGIHDEYVDKHTLLGRSMGRGWDFFISCGCLLDNEDEYWKDLSDQYRTMIK